jgi:limonene-1,2-epoxide hydrolase
VAEHPNVKRFKDAIAARTRRELGDRDRAVLEDLFAEDVVWHGAPTGGDVTGKDNVIQLWNSWAREQGGPTIAVKRVYSDGTHGFTEVEVSQGSGDSRLSVMQGTAYELNDDGKVTGFWGMPSDAVISASFASGKVPDQHPNMALFEEAEAVRNRQTFTDYDMGILHRFLDEHVIWHGAGRSAFKDGARERENVIALYKMFKNITGGTFAMTYSGFYVGDNHAASFVKLTGDVGPKRMNFDEVNLFHLAPDGHTYEFWGIAEDQEEIDAFWDPEPASAPAS